ncbi:hypothetical protein [Flavobacterium piscis]|uniref:Uncharacterized protein n=1 Tax=Flavobacterium piscis TaxID=1114874 RepID=A0ABU1YCE9_9FLAO|nr:hypothetical protein [Flavobacterium piscis]MDR7211902.1 hypothetical protein [Flavobacterium piscis]
MKTLTIYTVFLITTTILFMNRYTALYINNSIVHFIILLTASITFIFIIGQAFGKLKNTKSRLFATLIVGILCFIKSFLTWGGDWKTQTILYQNISNDNKAIEFQMRGDRFSFGYKKRVINRLKLFPGLDWTTGIDTTKINHKQWKKLNLYVNEMKFASH